MHAKHEIGGVVVTMTDEQAHRWNCGTSTRRDIDAICVSIPENGNQSRTITLRRAMSQRLEPAIASMLEGSRANRIGEWQ